MGYFLELSKSATSLALSVSELILLVSGIILVVGLIGEHKLPSWHFRYKVYELLVIIGCGGELLADGGIFLFSLRLQSISDHEVSDANNAQLVKVYGNDPEGQNATAPRSVWALNESASLVARIIKAAEEAKLRTAELWSKIQPRYLTKDQRKIVSDGMRRYSGHGFIIASPWVDLEAAQLAGQIKSALNMAGMGLDKSRLYASTLEIRFPIIKSTLPDTTEAVSGPSLSSGIELWGSDTPAVEALRDALCSVGKLHDVRIVKGADIPYRDVVMPVTLVQYSS
jgi:hypothetical protein